jgi:hypothetical protein
MQHLDFTSQLAGERQARYRAEAGRNRLAREDGNGQEQLSGSGSAPHRADLTDDANSAVARVIARLVGASRLDVPTPDL